MTELSDTERHAAVKALMQWFKSQEINPQEAALVMIELQAMCLVDKTQSIAELSKSCKLFYEALTISVAFELRVKGHA